MYYEKHIICGTYAFLFLYERRRSPVQKFPEFPKYTVFSAGDDNVNSYRIPSLLTAKDGSLLVFCEARRESWKDKSRTDIVVKRSTDNGRTWSAMQDLTRGNHWRLYGSDSSFRFSYR